MCMHVCVCYIFKIYLVEVKLRKEWPEAGYNVCAWWYVFHYKLIYFYLFILMVLAKFYHFISEQ